jgi:sugar phosphate isomerase/epimerase
LSTIVASFVGEFRNLFSQVLSMSSRWPIGVFASLDAGLGVKLEVAHELGVPTIQLHAPSRGVRTREQAEQFLMRLASMGITLTAVFGGFEGESYADIPTSARTVGIVPPETRAARVQEMKEIADFARLLGCPVVALHLGFIPHDASTGLYQEVVAVTRDICDHCRRNGQNLHLETGQETADDLLRFIADVRRDNLFINFDPANMILYGTGNPIQALWKVGPYVRSVHCKDGRWAANPGKEWGQEVPLGDGDVGFETYLRTLAAIGYTGPLTIEREIPQEPARQKAEVGQAVRLLERLKAKLG